jgi:hypothetical protein
LNFLIKKEFLLNFLFCIGFVCKPIYNSISSHSCCFW